MALLELEKIKKDINTLFGYVRCLMAKSDESSPLVATEWSDNHSTVLGNPYTAGTYVFFNGHVYKCKFDNDGIPPTNTTYWLDLGEGHLLAEEQSDWNATEGRRYIVNKPTKTSDFTNNGEDGSSPYVTQDELNNAIPDPQTLDDTLFFGDSAPDKSINVKEIGLYDTFDSPATPAGYAKIYSDKFKIWFKNRLGVVMASINDGGMTFIKSGFTFSLNFPALTGNRVATFQNASGVIAYLSDILTTTKYHGSFYHTNSVILTSGTVEALPFNHTDFANGISIVNDSLGNPTKITAANAGTYNVQFSAQLDRASGGAAKQVIIWLRKNGVDVSWSATHITMQANATYLVASWNFLVQLNAGGNVQLMWTQDDNINIEAAPGHVTAPIYPETPSLILTVQQV